MTRLLNTAFSLSTAAFLVFLTLGLATTWRTARANPPVNDGDPCTNGCATEGLSCQGKEVPGNGCSTYSCNYVPLPDWPCQDANGNPCLCGFDPNTEKCGCGTNPHAA